MVVVAQDVVDSVTVHTHGLFRSHAKVTHIDVAGLIAPRRVDVVGDAVKRRDGPEK